MTAAPEEMFARVGEAEEGTTKKRDDWETVIPVPIDAPARPDAHRNLGPPDHVYPYRDSEGLLGYVYRWNAIPQDDGTTKKETRPLTFCRNRVSGRCVWRFRHFDRPRPLYNLEKLAADPGALVLLTEGEKTADAAQEMLPDLVVVTTPGGANAARVADWSLLKGRTVVAWPDHDDAGRKYTSDAKRLCREHAINLRVVKLPEDLSEGWDLADALPEGWTAETVQGLIADAQKPIPASGTPLRERFRVDERGVWYIEDADGTQNETWLSSPLYVDALTRTVDSDEWGRLLEVIDPDGRVHTWPMPMSMLAGDGTELRAHLLSLGLGLAPGRKGRERLHLYLTTARPDQRARCVTQTGWHGGIYVMPDGAIGATSERIVLQPRGGRTPVARASGTLEGWQENVARPAGKHTRLVFGISTAFAAPLLDLVGEESGGVHLRGTSSLGKTIALRLAASVYGPPTPEGYLLSYRATANGLEGVVAARCDALTVLDELGQVSAREAGEIQYMLGAGIGKTRARRDGSARPAVTWRTIWLSSGEISLSERMAEAGVRSRAGMDLRMLDLPADAGAGLGIFDVLDGAPSGDALARRFGDAALRYNGTAIRAYLDKIVEDRVTVAEDVIAWRSSWVAKHCPPGADGQVSRAAGRFGLIAAAGELARSVGIVPWAEGIADDAAAVCFRAWLAARGGSGPAEIMAGIGQVRTLLEQYGEGRFGPVDGGADHPDRGPGHPLSIRWGFRRATPEGTEYFVLPEVWRNELCRGCDAGAIARAMFERKWIIPGSSEPTKPQSKHRLPGMGSARCYHVAATFLGSEGDGNA